MLLSIFNTFLMPRAGITFSFFVKQFKFIQRTELVYMELN